MLNESPSEPVDNDTSENNIQSNHIGESKTNGELEIDLSISNGDDVMASGINIPYLPKNTARRLSSTSSGVSPVNGVKAHDQNVAIIRMAVKQVKRPGKGKLCNNMYSCIAHRSLLTILVWLFAFLDNQCIPVELN